MIEARSNAGPNGAQRASRPQDRSLIRAVRNAAGLTQAELARRLGCEQTDVSRLERRGDRVLLSTLTRVAQVAGVSVRWVLSGAGTGAGTGADSEQVSETAQVSTS